MGNRFLILRFWYGPLDEMSGMVESLPKGSHSTRSSRAMTKPVRGRTPQLQSVKSIDCSFHGACIGLAPLSRLSTSKATLALNAVCAQCSVSDRDSNYGADKHHAG